MRSHGRVRAATGLGVHDHICWVGDDEHDWLPAALDYLRDGLRLGQRLVYVGPHAPGTLVRHLEPLPDVDTLVRVGTVVVHTLDDVYDLSHPLVPEDQLNRYAAANDQAIADGYEGLRVVADVTALVEDPARRAAHAQFEFLADAYMAVRPFSAFCVYDRRVLGDAAARDLACVHPLACASQELAPFSLFSDADALALQGEVDVFSREALTRALANVSRRDGDVVLDLAAARYLDHRAVGAFVDCSRDLAGSGARLVVRNASSGVRKICAVLGLDTRHIDFV